MQYLSDLNDSYLLSPPLADGKPSWYNATTTAPPSPKLCWRASLAPVTCRGPAWPRSWRQSSVHCASPLKNKKIWNKKFYAKKLLKYGSIINMYALRIYTVWFGWQKQNERKSRSRYVKEWDHVPIISFMTHDDEWCNWTKTTESLQKWNTHTKQAYPHLTARHTLC